MRLAPFLSLKNEQLVVEDDDVIVELIGNICLRIDPHLELDGTPSGEVAEALLRHEAIYDLVVMDVQLADKRTGIDVWRACRAAMPHTPFVFLSAMGEAEFRRRLGDIGDAPEPIFVPKPCSLLPLTHVLADALTDSRAA